MAYFHQEDMENLEITCPPSNADSGAVDPVYRFIENDTIEEIDFKTHKQRKKNYPPYKACDALAISFYTSQEAADKVAKKFESLKNKKIVAGRITEDCGVHNTKKQHLNLWQYQGINIMNVFMGEENRGEVE